MSGTAERGHIKAKAFAVIVNEERSHLLVFEGHDSVRDLTFHRLLGGHIEFGERAQDTVVREIREEIGLDLAEPRLLGVLESIFEHEGRSGHEVVFVYEGRVDRLETIPGGGIAMLDEPQTTVVWRDLRNPPPDVPLFPDGLDELVSPGRPRPT